MGNRAKVVRTIKKTPVVEKYKEFKVLLCAEVEENIHKKITYFQTLTKSEKFKYYSLKNLALLFYKQDSYDQAEHYALMAYDLNDHDAEILEVLMHCYCKAELWAKFTFVVKKLAKAHREKLNSISNEVSRYYLTAAMSKAAINDFTAANQYLEETLGLNCINPEILELYFRLNDGMNYNKKIKILKNSFKIAPSLEIVKLFQKVTTMSNEQICQELKTVFGHTRVELPLELPLAIELYLEKSCKDDKGYNKII